jgi:hypothetical protein
MFTFKFKMTIQEETYTLSRYVCTEISLEAGLKSIVAYSLKKLFHTSDMADWKVAE